MHNLGWWFQCIGIILGIFGSISVLIGFCISPSDNIFKTIMEKIKIEQKGKILKGVTGIDMTLYNGNGSILLKDASVTQEGETLIDTKGISIKGDGSQSVKAENINVEVVNPNIQVKINQAEFFKKTNSNLK